MTDNIEAPRNSGRNADGTFALGNPGKAKGTRHRTTRMLERMMQEDAEAVMRAVIDAARNGDTAAARMIIDRVAPAARKDAPIDYPLPKVENTEAAAVAMSAVIEAVGAGELTPEEGASVSKLLTDYARLAELGDLERRIAALEAATGK